MNIASHIAPIHIASMKPPCPHREPSSVVMPD